MQQISGVIKPTEDDQQGRVVLLLTAKGSACSQEMGAPHDAGLIFSGRDSGTATRMKQMSRRAMAVARITTKVSP